ncbi:DUF3173 domain-containing protein [Enterococcus faecalis]|uniref:DUF3173 family protein n=1 Tax=Enterococcus TaxID=1350 RepID=UPI0008BC4708|nr:MULTISPECIES: DUF3173 family protein [Enterococcus]MBC9721903.1 DUF3173 family protein [Lactobacillus sp.]EGO7946515.1 DUF3173 domain-containing protein [Enterococcus faecalis]EIY8109106.1 DUF3173 family protein [Enterococcus faecalis]EKQ3637146.1 DUF3173 family protein [Enterococcus faecalis]PQD42484.1 DUF3173 domain-containing protein [Enterococcus faecalis]
MISSDDLVNLGFKPYQAKKIIKESKEHLANIDGIELYYNRQIKIVPARIVEQLFGIQVLQ